MWILDWRANSHFGSSYAFLRSDRLFHILYVKVIKFQISIKCLKVGLNPGPRFESYKTWLIPKLWMNKTTSLKSVFSTFQNVVPIKTKFKRQLSICCCPCWIRRQQIVSCRGNLVFIRTMFRNVLKNRL